MIKTIALSLVLTTAMAVSAFAAPACSGSFAMSKELYTEAEINEYNLRALQSMGVDATAAEMWGGCIRAFVNKPEGGQEMQFFEPTTMVRVE